MDGVGAGDLAGRQQPRNVEIALGGRRRADADALVGELHVHRVRVGRRVDGDGRNAELLARPLDAKRNLAAIGYEDFVEHVGSLTLARD